jgi:hypothetical protein
MPAGHFFESGGVEVALQLVKPCVAPPGTKQVVMYLGCIYLVLY